MYYTDNMTTKDAIKMLPLSEDIKLQILRSYDYMEEEQKITICRIAWKTYFLLKQTVIDSNIEKQLDQVENGKEHLGGDFFEKVMKQSNNDMQKQLGETAGAVDLATARQAMYQIMQEMKDAKEAKKESHKTKQQTHHN
jgi:hypothetical protein